MSNPDYNTRIDEILLTLLLEVANDREKYKPLNWQAKYSNRAKDALSQLLLDFVNEVVGEDEELKFTRAELKHIVDSGADIITAVPFRNRLRAEIRATAIKKIKGKPNE